MRPGRTSVRSAVALAIAVAAAACGDDPAPSGPPDACMGSDGCGDSCNFGNSWGVGRYCTEGGGQCNDTPDFLAPFCTVDFQEGAVPFCTRPCEDETQCGEGAACTGDTEDGPKGCVPISCVSDEPDAGV